MNTRILLTSLLGLSLLTTAACVPESQERRSQRFDTAPEQLIVEIESGSVFLRADDVAGATVRVESHWSRVAPEVHTTLVDGVLRVEATCAAQMICYADFEISVPASTEVDLRIDNGSFDASGLEAPVRADLQNGSVDLVRMTGTLDLGVSNGSVTGLDLDSEQVTVQGCNGSIDLRLTREADVWAEVCHGSIDLSVPAGDYRLDLGTELGSVDTYGVSDTRQASHGIHARTSVGSVAVYGG